MGTGEKKKAKQAAMASIYFILVDAHNNKLHYTTQLH